MAVQTRLVSRYLLQKYKIIIKSLNSHLIDGLERSAILIDEEGKKTDYIVASFR